MLRSPYLGDLGSEPAPVIRTSLCTVVTTMTRFCLIFEVFFIFPTKLNFGEGGPLYILTEADRLVCCLRLNLDISNYWVDANAVVLARCTPDGSWDPAYLFPLADVGVEQNVGPIRHAASWWCNERASIR